jgi:hypothetical protein
MSQISWTGSFNPAVLTVADVYLNVVPPGSTVVLPASSGVLGVVGVASWGPKNVPTVIAGNASGLIFGPGPVVRSYDLQTAAAVALGIQAPSGIGGLMLSRVTDGTDVAATVTIGTSGLIVTSRYTGSYGSQATAALSAGSYANSYRLTLQMPGQAAEIFDNLGYGLTGNAVWVAMAAAINNGQSGVRGRSLLMVAAAGASVTAPPAGTTTFSLTGGTDGANNITSAMLVGANAPGAPTGVYAFNGSGISDLNVMDMSDPNQESALVTFALSQGIYVHLSGAPSETVSAAVANLATTGTDSPFAKRLLGDWVYWQDNYNGVQRLLAPGLFSGAILSATTISGSGLNKQISNVLATQRSRTGVPYDGVAELPQLVGAGIDVICNPIPQGNVFGLRTGRNTSSDGTRNGDNYPRLTSWLARSLAGPSAFGPYIGQDITPQFFENAFNTANTFCLGLIRNNLIQAALVVCSPANNPQVQTALGIVIATVTIQFFGIAMIFLVNLQTGQTVVIPANTQYSVAATAA